MDSTEDVTALPLIKRKARIQLYHDDDVEMYINGVPAASADGMTMAYTRVEMTQAAQDAILPNQENLLAVHCRQHVGGQYIDIGIDERQEGIPLF